MGCIHSKNDFLYRVYLDDCPGNLEINSKEIILYRKNREPTKWMLQHLRRYGFDPETEIFTFEAGRRCPTGEGIYTFRCNRAESLFHLLQSYIQQSDINTQQQHQQNGNVEQNSRPRSLHTSNSLNNSSSNYIIPSTIARPPLIRNGTTATISNSSDTLNFDGEENNYLEPTPAMRTAMMQQRSANRLNSIDSLPLSPLTGEPNSPGSPSSLNRILELTQLNEPHHHNFQNSNLYQEYPIKSENNNNINSNNNNELNRKLSLDIPPQEQAPTIIGTSNQHQTSPSHQVASPLSPQDADRTYVNITPGEILNTPTSSGLLYFPRSLTQSAIDSSTRCYENLEPNEIRSHLMQQQHVQSPTSIGTTPQFPHVNAAAVILNRNTRYSKPDIFAKTDGLMNSFEKSSEPSTPTLKLQQFQQKSSLPKETSQENHKVNYIVLDLDNSPSSNTEDSSSQQDPPLASVSKITLSQNALNNNNNNNTNNNNSNLINNNSNNSNTNTLNKVSTSINSKLSNGGLVSPDSPKGANNSAQTLGYATIDFNKTAALHNSTAPASDNDGSSRKTRHSATRQSNSISE